MQAEEIKKIIEDALPESQAIIQGDDGTHFSAVVISKEFDGKSRVQQQQIVYAALGDTITSGTLHALSLKTYTPDAWDNIHSNTQQSN